MAEQKAEFLAASRQYPGSFNPTRIVRPTVCRSSRKTGDTRPGNLPGDDVPPDCGCIAHQRQAIDEADQIRPANLRCDLCDSDSDEEMVNRE